MTIVYGTVMLLLVAAFVAAPLLRNESGPVGADPAVADLETRKEMRYREIREVELDHAAGKISDEDFRTQDAELKAEAVEILDQLDQLKQRPADETA